MSPERDAPDAPSWSQGCQCGVLRGPLETDTQHFPVCKSPSHPPSRKKLDLSWRLFHQQGAWTYQDGKITKNSLLSAAMRAVSMKGSEF